jgi:hypothetical protein
MNPFLKLWRGLVYFWLDVRDTTPMWVWFVLAVAFGILITLGLGVALFGRALLRLLPGH